MPRKKKSEKCIYLRNYASGSGQYYSVDIRYKVNGLPQRFSAQIKIELFPSKDDAFQYAIKVRDDAKQRIKQSKLTGLTAKRQTVAEVWQEMMSLDCHSSSSSNRQKRFLKFMEEQQLSLLYIDALTYNQLQNAVNTFYLNNSIDTASRFLSSIKRLYALAMVTNSNIANLPATLRVPRAGIPTKHITKDIEANAPETVLKWLEKHYRHKHSGEGWKKQRLTYYATAILYYTGMRPAEVRGLRRANVNLDANEIYIDAQFGMDGLTQTKTESSERAIAIPAELKPILKELLQFTKHDFLFAVESKDDVLDNQELYRYITKYAANKCGVKITPYSFRHAYADWMESQGASTAVRRDTMGHSNIAMTNHYLTSNAHERKEQQSHRTFSESPEKAPKKVQNDGENDGDSENESS